MKIKATAPGITYNGEIKKVGDIIEVPETAIAAAEALVAANMADYADDDEDSVPTILELEKMTVPQLQAIAESGHIEGFKDMKKAELVAAIDAKLEADGLR